MTMMTGAPGGVHEQVQGLRAPALRAAVDAGAACADPHNSPSVEEWFRSDGEGVVEWTDRSAKLRDFCWQMCPVVAQCRELALRQGEGRPAQDDMVRGGLSGQELVDERTRDEDRLAEAVAEDEHATVEWQAYQWAALWLAEQARSMVGSGAANEKARRANNARTREAAEELRSIRRVRRERAGWGEAA
ncbi:transcription factor WhiB [Streptomyces olivoreticuli]